MPTLEDVMSRQRETAAARLETKLYDLKARAAVASRMRELKADPHWQTWCDHVESIRATHLARVENLSKRLTEQFLPPQEYGETLAKKREAAAYAAGLKMAVDLIERLINEGEQAVETLKQTAT